MKMIMPPVMRPSLAKLIFRFINACPTNPLSVHDIQLLENETNQKTERLAGKIPAPSVSIFHGVCVNYSTMIKCFEDSFTDGLKQALFSRHVHGIYLYI